MREGKRKEGKSCANPCGEMQNPRSLARRRGKRRTEECLEICPTSRTKTKARACKNTHRYVDCKSKGQEASGSTKKEAFYGVFIWGISSSDIWRRKKVRLVQKKHNPQPSHFPDTKSCVQSSIVLRNCSRSARCCRSSYIGVRGQDHISRDAHQNHENSGRASYQ